MRTRLPLVLAAALACLFVAASPAQAATTCKSKHPVYSLKTYGSGKAATCSSALKVSSKLAARYKKPSSFKGTRSKGKNVKTTDGKGRTFACGWEAGSKDKKYVLWTCTRGYVTASWIWRLNR